MSHPNPYLFQISRAVEQDYRWVDIQQGLVRTRSRMFAWIQECTFILFGRLYGNSDVRTRFVVNNIHSK